MNEQRSRPRSRTLLPARITFDGGRSSVEAVVRDLSESGARLKVSEGVALPDTFRLHLSKTDEWRRARLIWRRRDLAGIGFEQEPRATVDDAAAAARRIRELEAEVVRLRLVLEELRADPGRAMQLLERTG